MKMIKWPVWVWVALVATWLAGLGALSYRYAIESANRAASIAVEFKPVADLVTVSTPGATASTLETTFQNLKSNGVHGIVINEDTIGSLLDSGRITLEDGQFRGDAETLARVDRALRRRNLTLPVTPDNRDLVLATACGISPEAARITRAAGLEIIARHSNAPGYSPAAIRDILQESQSLGVRFFLPLGDQVLGQRAAMSATKEALEALDIFYCSPEFTNLAGDSTITAAMPDRVVRLHAMQQAEIDRASTDTIVERYAKAFAERNMRWLLVRPPSAAAERPIESLGALCAAITKRVIKEGGRMKPPRPFGHPVVFEGFPILLALSAAAWILFLWSTISLPKLLQWAGYGVITLLAGAAAAGTAEKLLALLAALASPVLAYRWFQSREKTNPLLAYGVISVLSATGGLVVAGLLNETRFYIRADVLSGVQLAHFAPILIIALLLVTQVVSWRDLWNEPIKLGGLITGVVALMALLFMLSRTGNDSPSGVSPIELAFRSLLEEILPVRPRTKEFLIGHPALLIGLLLSTRKNLNQTGKLLAAGLLSVGAIGQTSIVNTLCHLHTPLAVGATRIVIGLLLGAVIGLLAWSILRPTLAKLTEDTNS